MATYDKEIDYDQSATYFKLKERHIYGSSRVGVRSSDVDLLALQSQKFSMQSVHYSIGSRTYELSNHLGNVLSVISDKVIPYFEGGGIAEMRADIRVAQDYSPFGVTLSGRNFVVDEKYRYGFNGMEKDDEVKGSGNSYTTQFRQYDPRLGRWLSIDPKSQNYPWQSPFVGLDNRPIKTIDPTGESGIVTIDQNSKTITIKSKNHYFSKGGRPNAEQIQLIKQHAQNIQDDWNAANAVKVIDGVEYKVQFEVEGKAVGTVRGSISYFFKEKIFKKGENNFIKVGATYSTNSAVGGSTQEMTPQDFYDTDQKTDSHEQGHLWGWFDSEDYNEDYPKRDAGYHDNDRKSDGSPSIMQDRNKLSPDEYSKRKVSQDDIDKILDDEKLKKKKTYKL